MTTSEAYQLASDGVTQLVSIATSLSAQEREHLHAANEPRVVTLGLKRDRLVHTHRRLSVDIESVEARSVGERPATANLVFAGCFALAGFVLARKTIEPFQLGSIGDLFAAGLALLAPYAVERFLRRFSRWVIVPSLLDIAIFLTAIATLIFFAEIRADVFQHQINGGATVVFDTSGDRLPEPVNGSERVANLLRWAMILAAIGFELACGLSWHDFLEARRKANSDLLKQLQKELEKTEKELLSVMLELQQSLSEPGRVYARFWTEFQQGLFDGMARIGRNTSGVAILLMCMIAVQALQAGQDLHIVASLDLSQTVQVKGFGGRPEFQENLQAISRLLAHLPSNSSVTVIGITDSSLMRPYTLLSADISADGGYFESRLMSARRSLVAEWNKRSKDLKASAPHTDVLGALLYSGQILSRSGARRKVVVVFSDMRHEANGLDLERPQVINLKKSLGYVERWDLVAPLASVDIFVFGAGDHSADRDLRYWRGLQGFWTEYFRRSGANLRVFSPGRDSDALLDVTKTLSR